MKRFIVFAIILLCAKIATAQPAHQHDAATTPELDHSAHAAHSTEHSSVAMNEVVAPDTARDPNEYSAGFTHDDGPFAYLGNSPVALADEHRVFSFRAERLEYNPAHESGDYELQLWHGGSFNRLVLQTHGSFADDETYKNQTEILWSHALDAFWNTQVGLRADTYQNGKNRQWFAAGIQGLAPFWFELDATAYVSPQGQTEFVFESEYELLLTQRLILQPRIELTMRGKDDVANLLGKGLSKTSLGLRLRYEFSRQFAPFIGIESERYFGNTAKLSNSAGLAQDETRYFLGLRFWL